MVLGSRHYFGNGIGICNHLVSCPLSCATSAANLHAHTHTHAHAHAHAHPTPTPYTLHSALALALQLCVLAHRLSRSQPSSHT
jgi:hypothetical protein